MILMIEGTSKRPDMISRDTVSFGLSHGISIGEDWGSKEDCLTCVMWKMVTMFVRRLHAFVERWLQVWVSLLLQSVCGVSWQSAGRSSYNVVCSQWLGTTCTHQCCNTGLWETRPVVGVHGVAGQSHGNVIRIGGSGHRSRAGLKNPGFKKKPNPVGFWGFYWVLGFYWFYWVFWRSRKK